MRAPLGPVPDPARTRAEPMPDPARGVFETLLARDGRVQALEAHLARLSCAVSDLYDAALPPQLAERARGAARGRSGSHRLRVDARPDSGALEIELQLTPLDGGGAGREVCCRPVVVPGGVGKYKWADRRLLESLADPGAVALILDRGDEVLEAAWANCWLIEGSALITPPADERLLPGVTRQLLLDLAPSLGLQAHTDPISLARARAADAIFLTSSLRHAVPAELEPGPSRSGDDSLMHPRSRPRDASLVHAIRAALAQTAWE